MTDRFTRGLRLLAFAALVLVLAAPAWASQIIYAQIPDYNGLFASQNDTSGSGINFTAYDNFTLGSAATISSVQWVGGYFNPPSQGPITGWTVGFYADNAGQPGSLLTSFGFSGTGGESFPGRRQSGRTGLPLHRGGELRGRYRYNRIGFPSYPILRSRPSGGGLVRRRVTECPIRMIPSEIDSRIPAICRLRCTLLSRAA